MIYRTERRRVVVCGWAMARRSASIRIACLAGLIVASACVQQGPDIGQLEGAWWSDPGSPTADFLIDGDQVWLDSFENTNPCRVEAGILVFDLTGEGAGLVRNRIISLEGDTLILENEDTHQMSKLTRMREP